MVVVVGERCLEETSVLIIPTPASRASGSADIMVLVAGPGQVEPSCIQTSPLR